MLKAFFPNAQVITANTCQQGLDTAKHTDIDIVLLDLLLPDAINLNGLERFVGLYPQFPVVIVSALIDPNLIQQAINLGALGFISKEAQPEEVRDAIETVLEGNIYLPAKYIGQQGPENSSPTTLDIEVTAALNRYTLTSQQRKVIELVAQFKSNRDIAQTLNCAEATVKIHVRAAFRAMAVKNRTEFFHLLHGKRVAGI